MFFLYLDHDEYLFIKSHTFGLRKSSILGGSYRDLQRKNRAAGGRGMAHHTRSLTRAAVKVVAFSDDGAP